MSRNPDSNGVIDRPAGLKWVKTAVRPSAPDRRSRALSLVDLFCSCGGFTLGVWEAARLRKRNLRVELAVDLLDEPLSVYRANFSSIANAILRDDVARLFGGRQGERYSDLEKKWNDRVSELDLLIAGPPCQGHSDLNNLTRRRDPRNSLYLRVARATEVMQPKVVIVENVPAVKKDSGKAVAKTLRWLKAIGYKCTEGVIKLGQFGVPQMRNRHFLVAVRTGNFEFSDLGTEHEPAPSAGLYLAGLENHAGTDGLMSRAGQMTERNEERVAYLFKNCLYDLPNEERPPCHRDKKHAYISMYGRIHWDKPAQTLTSGFGSMGQGRYVHPTKERLLTPREAARLQGLPDFFDFSEAKTITGLREMIANAVPPQFPAILVAHLIDKGLV
jgi:DNA (cytosine-5)-methyltransferase 1